MSVSWDMFSELNYYENMLVVVINVFEEPVRGGSSAVGTRFH
jgi:hypothetical protein